jgi:hypothetical protein
MTQHRADIPAVADGIARPLWSVMIPTFNCSETLRHTLKSVLGQDPGHEIMQIEVVDDHSTRDDPAAAVAQLGAGRVGFFRQERNVGHTRNFETCLRRAHGRLVHLLHGDDAVRPGFYEKMGAAFALRQIGAAFCRQIYMDQDGHWQGLSSVERSSSGVLADALERIASAPRIQTPSMVVRREVYEQLGGFDRRLSWTEDWEMWVRISARYPIWYEVEPLALYRIHQGSSTARHLLDAENVRDARRCVEIQQESIPPEMRDRLKRMALDWIAENATLAGRAFLRDGRPEPALRQLREALRSSTSLRVRLRVARTGTRALAAMVAGRGRRRFADGGAAGPDVA